MGPSLLRRIVLTMLAALVLVWLVLSLKDYWVFKQDVRHHESLGNVTQSILNSLQGMDASQAHTALMAADRVLNGLRRQSEPDAPGALLFRLSGVDGTLVYGSPSALSMSDMAVQPTASRVSHNGMDYWPVVRHSAHWRLEVWVPVMEDGVALMRIGLELLGYVLLALPLVLLPLLLAVWLGLRPLHKLSQRVVQREPDDLSVLQEPTGYAELVPLVDAFNALLGRVERLRQAERAFVQDAAHELKTPLAVIAAQAHALASATDLAQRTRAVQALEQGVQRAAHQVNQLLTLAAIEQAGAGSPQLTDLVELTRDVLIELEPLATLRGAELSLQSPDRLMRRVEPLVLRSVLVNLVRNAIEHGARRGLVAVGIWPQGDAVQLTVSDDGPGIAVSDRHRVFDRFYRADVTNAPGSGLGLAIVKSAASRLKATVHIEDGPSGRGVTVRVQF